MGFDFLLQKDTPQWRNEIRDLNLLIHYPGVAAGQMYPDPKSIKRAVFRRAANYLISQAILRLRENYLE
jgi:hypothetical protein